MSNSDHIHGIVSSGSPQERNTQIPGMVHHRVPYFQQCIQIREAAGAQGVNLRTGIEGSSATAIRVCGNYSISVTSSQQAQEGH